MSRKARVKSKSGIYHILITCVDKKPLFLDEEDRNKYMNLLMEYKKVCGYELYGYCLLDNHIHLLIGEKEYDISRIMKRIGTSYVYWFNSMHNRSGQLFEDRYKSEAVETDEEFVKVLRYICRSPLRSKSVSDIKLSKYNCFNGYFSSDLISSDKARRILGGVVDFEKYVMQQNNDKCLDLIRKEKKLTDEKLIELISKIYKIEPNEILVLEKEQRTKLIVQVLKSYNISFRQLARVMGISLTTIWRIVAKELPVLQQNENL